MFVWVLSVCIRRRADSTEAARPPFVFRFYVGPSAPLRWFFCLCRGWFSCSSPLWNVLPQVGDHLALLCHKSSAARALRCRCTGWESSRSCARASGLWNSAGREPSPRRGLASKSAAAAPTTTSDINGRGRFVLLHQIRSLLCAQERAEVGARFLFQRVALDQFARGEYCLGEVTTNLERGSGFFFG